ncbi:PilZ domain-containing protein [uncultured Thiomicrorhabdus sp.]
MENSIINNQDRRTSERHSIRLPCQIICNGVQVKATLVDISEEGLGFVTALPFLYEGRKVELIFNNGRVGDNDEPLRLQIEIKNQASDSFAERFGARLKEIPQGYMNYFKRLFNTECKSTFRRAFNHHALAALVPVKS